MRSRYKLSSFVVDDHFYPDCDPNKALIGQNSKIARERRQRCVDDDSDVVRERQAHICCSNSKDLQPFVRNFKILFLKGEDLLFQNQSLYYPMDNLAEIIKSLQKFRAEIAGLVPATMMMTLTGANQRSYEDATRGEVDENGEGQTVGKIFKPTISDLKLLIGTKEWTVIKEERGIDEDTPDQGAPEDEEEDDVDVARSDHFEGDSASGGNGSYKPTFGASRDQSYSVFENPNQSSAA